MDMVAEARGPSGHWSKARQLYSAHFAVRIGRLAPVVASPIASQALLAAAESGIPRVDIRHTGQDYEAGGEAGWSANVHGTDSTAQQFHIWANACSRIAFAHARGVVVF